ncbi:MAG: Rho termination factor N-terminal domain-containing protein, partial [Flavobacteriales bacterium]
MDIKELSGKSLNDLRVIAETLGIPNAQTLKKAELISALTGGSSEAPSPSTSEESAPTERSKTRPRKPRMEKEDTEQAAPTLPFETEVTTPESAPVQENNTTEKTGDTPNRPERKPHHPQHQQRERKPFQPSNQANSNEGETPEVFKPKDDLYDLVGIVTAEGVL